MGRNTSGTCTFEGCDQPVRARGFCGKHYKTMSRKGVFSGQDTPIDRAIDSVAKARVKLESHAVELVDALVLAAKVAASKGNSGPAEAALMHARVISPIATPNAGKAEGGIRVLVGVQLGTVPASPSTVPQAAVQGGTASLSIPASLPAIQAPIQAPKPGQPDPLPVLTAEVIPA